MLEYHPAEFVPVIRFIAIHIAHGLFSRGAASMARAGLDLAIAARPLKRARAVALGASARFGIWNAHIIHDFVPLFDCWCLHAESPALEPGQAGRSGRFVSFNKDG